MAWFQRYGVPGAYFWGIIILWLPGFYNCHFYNILTGDFGKTIGAIAVASFLPIGYLISVLQQSIYLWCKKPWFGITGRAIRKAGVFREANEREYLLEAEACLVVMTENVSGRASDNAKPNVDKQRFVQDWNRNRNNVMAINASLIIATPIAFLIAVFLPCLCLKWKMQFDMRWFIFAAFVTIIVVPMLGFTWYMLSEEVVRVEAGIYKTLAGLSGSNLKLKGTGCEGEFQDQE
jgi:hypothetical protein